MDPTAANVTAPAPCQSTAAKATAPKAASWIEQHVGSVVARAAACIAESLAEFQDGGLTSSTKGRGGSCIFDLYRLRCFLIADFPDFDRMARQRGTIALQETCGSEVAPATIDVLIDGVLEILAKVVRSELN